MIRHPMSATEVAAFSLAAAFRRDRNRLTLRAIDEMILRTKADNEARRDECEQIWRES